MTDGSFPPDESYSPALVVGGVSAGVGTGAGGGAAGRRARGRGAGVVGAGGAAAAATGADAFIRSAGRRLTLETVVAAGPT